MVEVFTMRTIHLKANKQGSKMAFPLKNNSGRSRRKKPTKIPYRLVWSGGVFECMALTMEIAIALFRDNHDGTIEQFWLLGGFGKWVEVPVIEIEEEIRFEERESQSPPVRVCHKCQNVREAAVLTPIVRYGIPVMRYTCEDCSGVQIPKKEFAFKASKMLTTEAIADKGKTVRQIVIEAFGLGISTRREINDTIVHQVGGYLKPEQLTKTLRELSKAGVLENVGRTGLGKGYQLNQKKGAGQ